MRENLAQTIFLHAVLILFASPGFLMPVLLYIGYTCVGARLFYRNWTIGGFQHKYDLFVWWICWVTLQNVHSLVEGFVKLVKCLVSE